MANITFVNQACILVEQDDVKLLCDPWLNEPVWVNAAIAFPQLTSEEKNKAIELINSATHIYISHDHEDHWDPDLLISLDPKVILVGNFNSAKFRKGLKKLEKIHEVIYVKHFDSYSINSNFRLKFYLEQPNYRVNSMCLFQCRELDILNGNDCGLDTDFFKDVHNVRENTEKPLYFLYTVNFIAGGYPYPYLRKKDPDYGSRILELKENLLQKCEDALKYLNPEHLFIFAGPNYLIDKVNQYLNDFPEAVDWKNMIDRLNKQTPTTWPALFNTFKCETSEPIKLNGDSWDSYLSRPVDLSSYNKDDVYQVYVSDEELLDASNKYFQETIKLIDYTGLPGDQKIYFSCVNTFDELEEDEFSIVICMDFNESTRHSPYILSKGNKMNGNYLNVISTRKFIHDIFTNDVTWNLLYGGRARLTRVPDEFNSNFHMLMTFGRDKLAKKYIKKWLSKDDMNIDMDETIITVVDGKKIEYLRYCPHEGQDLRDCEISSNQIVCPRHKWKFDIFTGQCLVGDKSKSLNCKILE